MPIESRSLGVDRRFPGGGNRYITSNGYYLDDVHGGPKVMEWIDENFEARDDDIYVVSFPKAGTTWAQEIVYLISTDLDFEKAKSSNLVDRLPYLELSLTIERDRLAKVNSPRLIKSHFPYSLLPKSIIEKNCKIIYMVRNPKDTVVSFYHFAKTNPVIEFQGDFKEFFELFVNEAGVIYTPFPKHVLEFWEQRHKDNILIVHYEDLHQNYHRELHRIGKFLGKNLTDDQVQKLADHCTFKSMKDNRNTNYSTIIKGGDFMRKGEVGDWKNYLSEEMCKKMDEYIENNFKDSSFKFMFSV